MDLIDAMRSQPANRYLKPDPIPNDVLYRAVDNAASAPRVATVNRCAS
ncbi:MAG: hypothetical protein R2710_29830 [Acidimicrobiales bacterium]